MKIEIKNETLENYSSDTFSYLKKFILCSPFLMIQPNLLNKPYSNIFMQDYNDFYRELIFLLNFREVKTFYNPSDLFDFVIKKSDSKCISKSKFESNTKYESKLKTIFINEIRDIINIMNDILLTELYQILFGRIIINIPTKQEEKKVDRRKAIDRSFYEGFGIE